MCRRRWTKILGIVLAGVALLVLCIFAVLMITDPTGPGAPTPTYYPPSTEPPPVQLEMTEGTEVSLDSILGEMEVKLPLIMSPGTSDMVIVSIQMPPQLASLSPVTIERVETPAGAPRVLGKQRTHKVVILIAESMRVELVADTFDPDPHYPAVQLVDIVKPLQETVWAWNITAPTDQGPHFLTVRVYREPIQKPTYVGSLQIDVQSFTPTPPPTPAATATPAPTPTPLPPLQQFVDDLIENSATVVAALIGLIGTLVTVTVTILATRRKKATDDADAVAGDEPAYNLAAIRDLLQAAFTAETLYRFCMDHPRFRRILHQFGPDDGLDDMIDEVIDFCETKLLWKEFLAAVAEENPRQYARFESALYPAEADKN